MALKKDVSTGRKGMQRDRAVSELSKEEYTFALNMSNRDFYEDGPRVNETSNVKCTGFKEGFTVIGHKFDPITSKTYFFLSNPTTGCSEIGYINVTQGITDLQAIEESCQCNISVVLETPLEDIPQESICEYFTVISDYCEQTETCTGCLNFSVDYPIFEGNIQIKREKTGTVMYWTDYNNPQRYIQLDHLDIYTTNTDDCEGTEVTTCLQCDKLRIFPLHNIPCLEPQIIQNGGNLRAGMYEVTIAMSDSVGDTISNCYSLTNPIPVHDKNNNVLDQTNLNYQTNQALKISVLGIDTSYDFYTIFVIYRSGLDGAASYYKYGVYPIGNTTVTINTLIDKEKTDIQSIISRKPFYTKAKGLSTANGYLFQYGLESVRTINLQPVVNLLGSAVKWNTYQAKENLYENGVYISNYLSYTRDEVEPIAIKFQMNGGHELPLFPLIPRPPFAKELETLVDDLNVQSINANSPVCGTTVRDKRWQFENTAIELGTCTIPEGSGISIITEEREVETSCTVSDESGITVLDTVVSGSVTIPDGRPFLQYINEYQAEILASADPAWADIIAVIDNPAEYVASCEPAFGDNCGTPSLTSEIMFAIEAETTTESKDWYTFSEYDRVTAPASCNTFRLDETLSPAVDTTFVSSYMNPGEIVYERIGAPANSSCSTASDLQIHTIPQIDNSNYLLNKGELNGFSTLQTALTVSATGANYTNKLHTNAIWFKVEFDIYERVVVEISPVICVNSDDNTGTSMRLSVFQDCSATSDIPAYGRIITSTSLTNDPLKFVELLASDFPSGTAYIAIDSGLYSRVLASTDTSWTLKPPCGCFAIYRRESLFNTLIDFTNLKFGKKQTYTATCTFTYPDLGNCSAVPYKYGLFSHWESALKYPCNKDLFDSSWLEIDPDSIPVDFRAEFEDYYVQGGSAAPVLDTNGYYVLTSEADFMDKPIRHYKFPDNRVAPFMSDYSGNPGDFKASTIYPIGFFLSNDVINAFLDIAVSNGLLTAEERFKITKYEIFRGDRSVDKSVLAKGLMFDMYQYYSEDDQKNIQYPNYPLNSLGLDELNVVGHPFNSVSNNRFTFHSPDIHFYKPTLGKELSIEGYQFGKSQTIFDEVRDYPTYVLLGKKAYSVATTLAITEASLEIFLQVIDYTINATAAGTVYGAAASIIIAVAAGIFITVQGLFKVGEYRYRWLETFKNIGKPQNFAYYSATLGYYNNFLANDVVNSRLRGLTVSQYIKPGNWIVADEVLGSSYNINNIDREDSVFLTTGSGFNVEYPTQYVNYDTYGSYSSRLRYEGTGRSGAFVRNAASPYVALKQYLPEQFGSIDSVEWIFTNYCGVLSEDNSCDAIFGGDTYISRFALKRKLPFFTTSAYGLAPLTPYKHSEYFNINPNYTDGRYYLDYELNDDDYNISTFVFPENKSKYNLDYMDTDSKFYVKTPAKFYVYSYGIPYFLVESTINVNFRYAKREAFENFYPNISDTIDFTQESNISIKQPNTYFYNDIYSLGHSKYPYYTLHSSFDTDLWKDLNNLENAVIYSRQDNSESTLTDPWLVYKPLDFYNFPASYGKLTMLDGIESEQVLGIFENGFTVFGAIDQIKDRVAPDQSALGTGGIFTGRNINFNKTDLGYAGSQNTAKISCEFGHFWADAKRGKVFQLGPNAASLDDITVGLTKWFKEHLPFKILQSFPDVDTDNTYKWFGITMGWDDRLKRLFITKKDFKPNGNVCFSAGAFFSTTGYDSVIAAYQASGYTYQGIIDCKLQFTRGEEVLRVDLDEVEITDSEFFTDCSFTIGYDPQEKSWVSYYSFKPNYYITYPDYFQTGINYSEDVSEIGLWSHYPFISSYQVFYGKRYPWILEVMQPSSITDSVLHSVEYWMETKKFYNRYDFSDIVGVGFNKAYIYNNHQNSGLLNIVSQEENNAYQMMQYPIHNSDSADILQSETNGRYAFNHFYNLVRKERSGLPLWRYDCPQILKELNLDLLDFRNNYKDRLRGDYFLVRFIQDKESRYRMAFRLAIDNRDFYQE